MIANGQQGLKDNQESGNTSGRNNNNVVLSSRLVITEAPKPLDSSNNDVDQCPEVFSNVEDKFDKTVIPPLETTIEDVNPENKGLPFIM